MYKFFSAVLFLAVCAIAQPGEGGYVFKALDGSYSTWSAEQALNSMADWYACKTADSTATTVSSKYGTHYRLKQIANISATTQKYVLINLNTLDTFKIHLAANSFSGKLPAIKRVISGAVADSTVYYFQYK